MIPLHPEAVPGDPATVRWRHTGPELPAGTVTGAPAPLAALIGDGTVQQVVTEPGALLVTLGPGRSWRVEGPRIRTALHTALESDREWQIEPTPDPAVGAVTAVLEGPAGAVVRAHGGSVRVVAAHDGVVDLELTGACAGCPASGLTIETTLAAEIRRAVPGVRQVQVRSAPAGRFVPLSALLRRPS